VKRLRLTCTSTCLNPASATSTTTAAVRTCIDCPHHASSHLPPSSGDVDRDEHLVYRSISIKKKLNDIDNALITDDDDDDDDE
jgi:hypothetical protein